VAVKAVEIEASVIEGVCARVRERVAGEQVPSCEAFVRQYYHWAPPADLAARSDLDLYGAAIAHWNLAQVRAPGTSKIAVYNPDFEQHGWQSPHTAIELVTDDMPFLVDSVSMELHRQGLAIHLVIHPVMRIKRDADGRLVEILQAADAQDAVGESILHAEVDRVRDPAQLQALEEGLERVLGEVRAAVRDWKAMRERAVEIAAEIGADPGPTDEREATEASEFLTWMAENHYTFLGYREYAVAEAEAGGNGDRGVRLTAVPGSGLGILGGEPGPPTTLPPKRRELVFSRHHLILTKANSKATIHRPTYLDYVGVRRFDADGKVVGERRFLGLYTSAAYKESPRAIPLLRGKVDDVLSQAGFPPNSHDKKALIEILEAYPRDSLFQIQSDELFEVAMGVLGLGERQRVRLFARRDPLDRFVSCLVYIPRDRFNTEARERVGTILLEVFGGSRLDWGLLISESVNVRVHYVVHCDDGIPPDVDIGEVEARLAETVRAWADDLHDALAEELGEERGAVLFKRYHDAFPASYRADWVARSAVSDITRIEDLEAQGGMSMSLYRPLESDPDLIRCKLVSDGKVPLSDLLPTFEHMGARVLDERPYQLTPAGGEPVWVYDFGLRCAAQNLHEVREAFQQAFLGVWRGVYENDGLNGLVLEAGLTGREVTIVRAVAKYLRQAGIAFTDGYMERTLIGHAGIARLLVQLFAARFDLDGHDDAEAERLTAGIEAAIDGVRSLDEDRILRSFLSVVQAIVRTNFYRRDEAGGDLPYVSFKVIPALISILPLPRPKFEIFVYSPRVEGVHLRGGRVARGGLRWSDRREDFRTEVLGLMKAQMVKNALIVPVGSKGGFVVKQPPAEGGREALMAEGIACYKTFLSGLLDLTDNIVAGKITPPPGVVRYDEDDPYLVVAADKGTATFSDIANGVSLDYGFWLGDAFASGGSQGYDHKAMGITARGAWESVKRHFRELGTDTQTEDFAVVGIGDMSGDVFGNGMLLSEHIKLVCAFNHLHVFLDPNPDPATSFAERKRLFELPRSSWSDYDISLISKGGAIFERTAKSIPLTPQVKAALGIEADELAPAELIHEALKAPVDLLWNGGIGTYVKSRSESHADAGDKANDAVRVDGAELRCRVVGEGGNLGCTQLGRIEYALAGGRINTDAIDNVAGVNCSDHEVNIKILLGAVVDAGDMTAKQRNELLVEMTDAVAERVLYGSYTQTQAMSLAGAQAVPMVDVHQRLIRHLEQVAGLDRAIEFLPNDEEIGERKVAHQGLTAPELAVVMAYCKIHLYADLLESDLPEDAYLAHDLQRYFPPPLPERYERQMHEHRLRREIIATVVANQLVDRAGTTFAFRLGEETGASAAELSRAYAAAREIFWMRELWKGVEALDNKVDAQTQLAMLIEGRRLVERATRWLVRSSGGRLDIAATVSHFAPGAEMLDGALPGALTGADREAYATRRADYERAGVPSELASRVAYMPSLLSVLDIVEVAGATGQSLQAVTDTYFELGARLELNWLRDRIIELPRANRWQALARAALRDDLFSLQRALAQEVLEGAGGRGAIDGWVDHNMPSVQRTLGMIADIKASRIHDTTTLPVALREVRNLIRDGASDLGSE
jgi:glutamate dehydrogenase